MALILPVIILTHPITGAAQDDIEESILNLLNANVGERAAGALAVLGMTVVPNETASTLFLDSDRGKGYGYQASQLGGAFTLSDEFPLYAEGFVGYSRYDPVFVFSDGEDDSLIPIKWTTVAATGGLGWDFPVSDNLVFRPILNVSIGYIVSDSTLLQEIINEELGTDIRFLDGGELLAGGIGTSMMLDYELATSDYEVDSELRLSYIHLEPILNDSSIDAQSDAVTVGWWNRLRVPTGIEAMRRPLRAVFEASASLYPGDQGKMLQTDWMLQGGLGLELDFSDTWVPISRGRVMGRYAFGERLEGYSIGFAVTF